jgi:hypothetical protein
VDTFVAVRLRYRELGLSTVDVAANISLMVYMGWLNSLISLCTGVKANACNWNKANINTTKKVLFFILVITKISNHYTMKINTVMYFGVQNKKAGI